MTQSDEKQPNQTRPDEKRPDQTQSHETLPKDERNPWITNTNDVVYDNPWIQVSHRQVITPTGTDGIYGVVSFKNTAIGVIPIDDEDHTWLVGQYRYTVGHYTWEIPEGGGPRDEDPAIGARRELREECGLLAEHLEPLLYCDLSNSVTDEQGVVFLATGLTTTETDPDDTEVLDVRRVPVDDAIDMALRGEIVDSLSLMGLLRLATDRARS